MTKYEKSLLVHKNYKYVPGYIFLKKKIAIYSSPWTFMKDVQISEEAASPQNMKFLQFFFGFMGLVCHTVSESSSLKTILIHANPDPDQQHCSAYCTSSPLPPTEVDFATTKIKSSRCTLPRTGITDYVGFRNVRNLAQGLTGFPFFTQRDQNFFDGAYIAGELINTAKGA
jgi:hypothetical protein